jgi:hypothetical protein
MVRALLILLPLVLTLYTFVDCAMRDDSQIKKIPKWGWLLVILFLQPIGGIVSANCVDQSQARREFFRQMMIQISYAVSS